LEKNNNLDSKKVEQRREELEMVLKWKIVPQLDNEDEYRVTVAYNTDSSNLENIKILGFHKGNKIPVKILAFFDEFLTNVNSFGLLVESRLDCELKNWDISFSKRE
jgi:hypothetical protein